ncbi:MAG: sensor domain-containing diguanylate cyclase/phosphohydrolase [Bacillota bacterium]
MNKTNPNLLASILDVQDNLVILLNLKGEIIKFNKACEKITGYSLNEVKNEKIWKALIKNDEITETKEVFTKLKDKNFPNQHENYLKTKNGDLRLISWTNNVLLDENNEVKYIVATGRDITEKKWNEKILKKSQQIANLGSWKLDLKNNELFWSEQIYRIFGLKPQEFEVTYEKFLDIIHPEDRKKVDNAYISSIEENKDEYEVEHRIIKQDSGEIRYVKEKCEHIKNDNGEIVRSLGIVQDITERKKREEKIKYLSYKDRLTDLYNRRFFEEEISRLDTDRQLPISIIMADINGLKIINDSYGHKKGDELLAKTAKILKNSIRKEDILARHGGDEFAILLPKTTKKEAGKIINRIKEKTEITEESSLPVSIGLGKSTKEQRYQNIDNILKQADNNMYKNKLSESKSAKNRIIQNLLNTLGTKSSETKKHALRMTTYAHDLGEKIGLSNSDLNRLSLLATLHDIGKTTISEDILTKPGKLTDEEWEIIKEHPKRGYKIASASEEFAVIAGEILSHHERWDGNGYPNGLKEKEIPYLARIISIIDAYDVMTSERPYSKAISKKKALTEIKDCAGTQFDPVLAEKFIKLKEDEK